MGDLLPLHDPFREAIQTETAEQKAEGSDHGHDAEIGGSEQACENHGRDHLQYERRSCGEDRHPSAAGRSPAHFLAFSNGMERAVRIKRVQLFPQRGRWPKGRLDRHAHERSVEFCRLDLDPIESGFWPTELDSLPVTAT